MHDAYYTPDALAAACVARCGILPSSFVVEPSVGGGAWVRALRAGVLGVHVTGIDIDPEAAGLLACNVSRVGSWTDEHVGDWDWSVGNPPYSDAEAHVRASLARCHNVAALLRVSFLGSRQRLAFWHAHPADEVVMLSPRPSFTGGGSDTAEYALFIWRRGAARMQVSHLDWRK